MSKKILLLLLFCCFKLVDMKERSPAEEYVRAAVADYNVLTGEQPHSDACRVNFYCIFSAIVAAG